MTERQSANTVMMVRPLRFTANPLTASSNAFQINTVALEPDNTTPDVVGYRTDVLAAAQAEFDALVEKLEASGVRVLQLADSTEPEKPDSVFPNNWVTTHADGSVVLYPMLAKNRRSERRPELISQLSIDSGFAVESIIDFSPYELQDRMLEGTGSMILDRVNQIVYACRSPRTHPEVLDEFCLRFDYRPVLFDSVDRNDIAIYHTNVMMALGTHFAVVCTQSVRDDAERAELLSSLADTGHEIIDIDYTQLENFAGNMLELSNGNELLVAMSQRASDSLTDTQRQALSKHARIISSPINTIEDYGGGSVRCMLAEIFLPAKQSHD